MRSAVGKLPLPLLFAVTVVALVAPQAARAHETEQPYLYTFVTEATLDGRVELAVDDVAAALGADLGGDDSTIEATLRDLAPQLRAFVAEHVQFGPVDASWPLELGRVDLFREGPGALAFAVVQYSVDVPDDLVPTSIEVEFDPFFDDIGRDGLVLVAGGWTDGAFDPDFEALVAYGSDSRRQTIDLGDRSRWDDLRSGVTLGVDHIRTGPDHVLFVLALLLPSVLVFSAGWHPTRGFGSSLWRVLKIATFFTLAHSITFTLAGMGWLPTPPSKIVEAIIAASIAAAALHNLRPVFPNREWALAFAFGLFHGMGFASLVASLDVSRTSQLVSLLGRNIGIEIGQVVVIAILFPALYLLRRTPVYRPVLVTSSIALAVLALAWMTERLFEADLGTDDLVDRFASTPNGYWIAAISTVIAAIAYVHADRAGTLIPVLEPALDTAGPDHVDESEPVRV